MVGRRGNSDELRQVDPVLIRPAKAEIFQASTGLPAIWTVSPAISSTRAWSGIVALDLAQRGLAERTYRPAVVESDERCMER